MLSEVNVPLFCITCTRGSLLCFSIHQGVLKNVEDLLYEPPQARRS